MNDLIRQIAGIITDSNGMEHIGAVEIVQLIKERERRYRKMLYDMTSLRDWQSAGYDGVEYSEIVKEFDQPGGEQ